MLGLGCLHKAGIIKYSFSFTPALGLEVAECGNRHAKCRNDNFGPRPSTTNTEQPCSKDEPRLVKALLGTRVHFSSEEGRLHEQG